METLDFANIASFAILFVGLCCFVFFALISYNLYTKSYRPQEVVLVILTLIILFIINWGLFLLSAGRVVEGIMEGVNNPPSQSLRGKPDSLF